MNHTMFNSEVEKGSFLVSSDVISYIHDAILNTSTTYKLHKNRSGFDVLVFSDCSRDYKARFLNREFDLVSSERLKFVNFITTSFSINEAAVSLFVEPLFIEILELKDQLIKRPLVVTGQSLGGYIAILFVLWLQHVVDVEESNGTKGTKRPICLTFGSPLVGDGDLQKAVFDRPQWKSCFLNVVAKTDPFPSFLLSNDAYKPLGAYLFCTESGGFAFFEDQDSILEVLKAMSASSRADNLMHDYKKDLSSIKRKVLYRGVSTLGAFSVNSLQAGIVLQLLELDMIDPQVNNSSHVLINKMEMKQAKIIKSKRNVYEPTRKLNDMKISLTYMEWYMKKGKEMGGYYDRFKNAKSKEEIEKKQEIIKHQRRLNQYWKKFVEEKDGMPQKEGAKLRKRWLYGGTNYRRIVEPLDIADHYKNGNKNYIASRPNHYKLLEKLLIEDNKDSVQRNNAASLTEDSCFWAYVEEALILLRESKDGSSTDFVDFEDYVMHLINNYLVSPDVFLEGSGFMRWWREYKTYNRGSNASSLAQYMNNEGYRSYK